MTEFGEKRQSERRDAAKVVRRFAKQMKAKGYFQKSSFFSQEHSHLLRFIHVHKFSFGPCFRLHACIRVANDSMGFLHLNGISREDEFAFDQGDLSLSTCADSMLRFVAEVAEPWFETQTTDVLLRSNSILGEEPRQALQSALHGTVDESRVQLSRSLLGLPRMREGSF